MLYLILNKDETIHTISENDDNVLLDGQKKIELSMKIEDLPEDFDNRFYKYASGKLVKRSNKEINNIIDSDLKKQRINKKIEAQTKLSQIKELELADTNEDYSEVKAKYQKIIEDNKA